MIHHSAEIGETSIIGIGTQVWQFASVIRGARLGDGCNLASCAIVDGAVVGSRCLIGHGASVHPGSVIGNDVFIGPGAVLCNDGWPRVSKDGFDIDWLIMGGVSIRIKDGASIGAGAVIMPGVTIGAGAMVAAGAVVNCDVPDCHLFKRSGEMVPIDPARVPKRIRTAV